MLAFGGLLCIAFAGYCLATGSLGMALFAGFVGAYAVFTWHREISHHDR